MIKNWFKKGTISGRFSASKPNKSNSPRHGSLVPPEMVDREFLKMCEGSIFQNTTLPSGWKTPDKEMIARNGVLQDG